VAVSGRLISLLAGREPSATGVGGRARNGTASAVVSGGWQLAAEIDGFSTPGAEPVPWSAGLDQVATADTFWLSTAHRSLGGRAIVFRVRPVRGLGFRKGDAANPAGVAQPVVRRSDLHAIWRQSPLGQTLPTARAAFAA